MHTDDIHDYKIIPGRTVEEYVSGLRKTIGSVLNKGLTLYITQKRAGQETADRIVYWLDMRAAPYDNKTQEGPIKKGSHRGT